ncbi:MAG: FAD-binding protein [Solobacterium sp.]|nr:FAD-binding protein [Solobacterium sp.]
MNEHGKILIIGSGIAGMSCAVRCAELGLHVQMVSPYPSERSQSVMASGGINAVLGLPGEDDTIASHIEDTLKGGSYLGGEKAVTGLCESASDIIAWLEKIGTVFSRDSSGTVSRRAFGGQSHKRTCYCGAATGKQIVTALVMECREMEVKGLVERLTGRHFYSALIEDGKCYGALLFNQNTNTLETVYANALIMATGGQNALFGKTTGSTLCDGYAIGQLFRQGAELKNLEFIQFHPTTLETSQKKMMITEAVRGEGGRLFYELDGKRIWFMEDKYGPNGNLMTRDIVAREISAAPSQVYLDISFLDPDIIDTRLSEVRDLCAKYRNIDIKKEPIPVTPSVHFFMGGLAVHMNHETNIRNLFAIGECASMYHGANRLGGNSLLSAIHSARITAEALSECSFPDTVPDFSAYTEAQKKKLTSFTNTESNFPVSYIRDMTAEIMQKHMGIIRDDDSLNKGLEEIDYCMKISSHLKFDSSVNTYLNYSMESILILAKATLLAARARCESRGAHWRSDFPDTDPSQQYADIISYDNGAYSIRLDREHEYES